VLAYIYGPRNAGDMALNYAALDLLNTVGDFDIVGLSRFSAAHESFSLSKGALEAAYANFRLFPFPLSYDRHSDGMTSRIAAHARGFGMCLRCGIGFPNHRANALDENIRASDYLLFNGGNVLFSRGFRDLMRLMGVTYPLWRATKLQKPVIFLPQSIPVALGFGRRIIHKYLESARFASFRESTSMEKIQLKRKDTISTLDLAFFMKGLDTDAADEIMSRHQLHPFRFVPVVPRATTLGDHAYLHQDEYRRTVDFVVRLCERVAQAGCSPLLVVQVQTDLRTARDCQAVLATKGYAIGIEEQYNPLALRALYASSRAIITMRLHAAIFALSVGTVPIGFYRTMWGQKMPGIFSDLGIKELSSLLDMILHDDDYDLGVISDDAGLDRYERAIRTRICAKKADLVSRLRDVLS